LRTAHDLLAPCGGAMIIRREVYRAVGGFDEDYIAYYEDLDLGWRLWLYGYRVVFAPDAIVYHRQHQTGIGFPVEKRYAQSEMNALRTVIKNYDDTNFMRMLSLSLFLAVRRSLDQVGLNREEYRLGQPPQNNGMPDQVVAASPMSRVATAILVAVDRVAEEMPQLLAKRQRIQAARVRSDAEIFARFPMRSDNPVFPWRQYTVVHDELAQALGVPAVLQPHHGSRLLIITHETIGPLMAGPGIRAWEMARALARHADITLAAPGSPQREQPGLRVVGYDPQDLHLQALAPHLASADVVLAMGPLFARYRRLQDLGKPTIVDLYDPFELEKLAQAESAPAQPRPGIDQDSRLSLQLEGAAGDFFLCASERQRDLWLGTLLASGRVNTVTYGQDPTLRNLIDVVPFGISEEAPRHDRNVLKGIVPGIAEDDRVLLWNGGLWQWLDPLTLIDAMPRVLAERGDVKLYFAAGKHFDTDTVSEMPVYGQVRERSRELGLLDKHVFFGNWIPYDERGAYLLEADLAVSLHRPGLESRFASRTRLLDCIWAGLPVVAAEGDPIGERIGAHELGFLVPPGQPDVLAKVILAALGDQNLRERTAARSLALRSELAWDHCVQPIVSFLGRAA
ncbi:MAG TPA: glycosyltransferase, partial [Anaerolineae bacterium]